MDLKRNLLLAISHNSYGILVVHDQTYNVSEYQLLGSSRGVPLPCGFPSSTWQAAMGSTVTFLVILQGSHDDSFLYKMTSHFTEAALRWWESQASVLEVEVDLIGKWGWEWDTLDTCTVDRS